MGAGGNKKVQIFWEKKETYILPVGYLNVPTRTYLPNMSC